MLIKAQENLHWAWRRRSFLFLEKELLIYLSGRESERKQEWERERASELPSVGPFSMCLQSWGPEKGWKWEWTTQDRLLAWVSGAQLPVPSLLPPRIHISRKLELGPRSGIEPNSPIPPLLNGTLVSIRPNTCSKQPVLNVKTVPSKFVPGLIENIGYVYSLEITGGELMKVVPLFGTC